jgi:hypothetical protein
MNETLLHVHTHAADPYDFDAAVLGIVAVFTIVIVVALLLDSRSSR